MVVAETIQKTAAIIFLMFLTTAIPVSLSFISKTLKYSPEIHTITVQFFHKNDNAYLNKKCL